MAGEALKPNFARLRALSPGAAAKDGIAGCVLAILLVPQAMAYAQLAGLPPQMGLFAALLPPVLYFLFGTSAHVSVGPVALVSLVVAEAVGGVEVEPALAAAVIAIEAGALLVLLGGFGLGRLVNFISEPVLLGFTAAAALLLAASQLPPLLGIDAARAGDLPTALSGLFAGWDTLKPQTAMIGIAALVVLLIVNRLAAPVLWKLGIHPPYRQAIAKSLPLAVIVGAAFAALGVPNDVPTVSGIAGGLPPLVLPPLDPALWLNLLPSAAAVAVIVFVVAAAVAKSLAGNDRSQLDTSREATALGFGNIAAALTGGYAIGASLSRSALVADSGAKSPLASVFAALLVLIVLLVASPLLVYLPRTALAALVISAVFGLIKTRDIRDVWRHDPMEAAIIAVAFVATLLLGVRLGLAIGAVLGLGYFLWFSSVPRVTRIGTDDGGASFRSVDRADVDLDTKPVLIVRIDRSLFFGNAAFCEEQIFDRLGQPDGVTCLVLDMRAVNDIDASGAAMLRRVVQRLRAMGITLHFAELHEPVKERLGPIDSEVCRFHRTVGQAVEHCGVSFDDRIAYS